MERIYRVRDESVNKALELLQSRKSSHGVKRRKQLRSAVDVRTALYCCNTKLHNSRIRKRKRVSSSGFSQSLVTLEMRKCLMRHDWAHVAELLPLLLDGRAESEPLVWRYLVAQLLYNPKCTLEKLNYFSEMCVNSESSEFLKKVSTILSQTEESDSGDPAFDSE